MKKIYTIFVCICLLAGFVACEKDKDFVLTKLTVQNETITPSYGSATIDCSFKADATISEAFVQYSLSSSFAKYDVAKMTEEKGKYAALLLDLQDNTTYYIRYAVSNKYSSVVSEEVIEFQTLQCTVPTVVLDSIADVWDNRAKAHIHLTFDGGASVTDMGICWSKQANPTIEDIHKSTKDTVAVLDMTDLQENTQYYVRAYAVNKVGVSYSEEQVFTTYALPEVRTEEIDDIQVNVALLSATLLFDGNDTATIKGFCWSDKAEPTIDANHIAVDTTSAHYTYLLSELLPATEYHIRAYAKNKIGVAYGEAKTFTTTKDIVSPTVTTATVTQITETTAVAGGNVTSDGGAEITERGVVYATTQNPTTNNIKVKSGTGTGSFTCDLTVLQPNTKYYVRAYAINEKGTAYGEEVTFITNKQIVLPSVITSAITQITETSAVAGGNVTSDGGASVTERGVVYATTQNPTTNNIKVKSGTGTGSFTCNLTDLQPNTTYYVRAYATNEVGTAYGEEVSFTTQEQSSTPNDGTENGYAYVDLGLSVKWATMNVGASSPEDYGDYFAWGETEPKDVYEWSTYKWCNGSYTSITKYNTHIYYGTVDNKTTLELSDDAAHVNWGGRWRMPTIAEQEELTDHCTWTWTTQYGVNGYKVTSKKNGRSIFLPAAGYRSGSSLYEAGSYGIYWSSSLKTIEAYLAYSLSNGGLESDCSRVEGRSVRPVLGDYVMITTSIVTQITASTAVAGGNVTSDGGDSVTERGVVFATKQNPTTDDNKLTCGSGMGEFTCTLTGLQANTTYYVRAYAVNSKGITYGGQVSFTAEEKNNGKENGHEYVDLGLSVKWATMNVGASKPEAYGNYFAWGEISTKSIYDWSTYKYYDTLSSQLTKYYDNDKYGNNGLTTLELSDDAAHVNWGGSWRMPTDAEWLELIYYCTCKWTTQNGVYGCEVTSRINGNSIFLPAAGYRYNSSLNEAGSHGFYWSSSLGIGNNRFLTTASLSSSDCLDMFIDHDRSDGQSVRPVCP